MMKNTVKPEIRLYE